MLLKNENPNKPAITTKNILNGLESITRVIYDPDGDWQFFSKATDADSDFAVISIKQAIDIDESLLQLPEIKKNTELNRNNNAAPWMIKC
ncbi:MAG: hypothetical protein IPK50_15010 [Fibrobacterota bacterium]|nr:hypothetical protein [Fibrobacterota bacterium]QQS03602.1 MAG: hypothetical protein IPK50_15010 [Fibrobacterota bacterium]